LALAYILLPSTLAVRVPSAVMVPAVQFSLALATCSAMVSLELLLELSYLS